MNGPTPQKFVIGIAGRARSGKDTLADFIVNHYGFVKFAFADRLKDTCCGLFGWGARHRDGDLKEAVDPYLGFSPRQAFQVCGTEFARALNPDIWVLLAERAVAGLVVIPDVRFENEAEFCRKNGVMIHVSRDAALAVNRHASEKPLVKMPLDHLLVNNGSLREMYRLFETMIVRSGEIKKGIQAMASTKLVGFCGTVKYETEFAYLVNDGERDTWIPKSQVDMESRKLTDADFVFLIPEWLAMAKGII